MHSFYKTVYWLAFTLDLRRGSIFEVHLLVCSDVAGCRGSHRCYQQISN